MEYSIVPIDTLLPLELVFPTHLKNLEELIDNDGFMLKAIIIDKKTGTILDGSHRYVYLLKKGYKTAPVYYVDYDDEDVRVGTHLAQRFLIEGDTNISKAECRNRAISGDLFSPRTTRHFFPFRKIDISLPLTALEKGESIDVSSLISDVTIAEELTHNKKYVSEIGEEIEIIIQYLSEVTQTRQYLIDQISNMQIERVAFFPGKFHPPHLGHLKTLLDISDRYSKLIIGVSEHRPSNVVTTVENIISILETLFRTNDNIEVVRITGTLVDKKDVDDLPKFDVLLSGNEDVLSWASKLNIANELVPRSDGYLFSGTEVRDELRNS
jgi:nicotinamide mononucleotide adenylyltransferase